MPENFARMRVGDFWKMLEGYNRTQLDEFQKKAALTRLQTVVLVNVQLPANKRITNPAELWRFPWENEPVTPVELTEDERREQLKLINKLFL